MKYDEITDRSYRPPTIDVGDNVLVGKFKNRKATVTGFTKDDHQQPVLKTSKGEQKLFKPSIVKLDEPVNEIARPPTRSDADRVLRTAGYQRTGKGAFGAIYHKAGKSYVLKVFAANDAAYLDFIRLAQAHGNNQHFPRFFGKVVHVTPQYCAIRMEPLSPYKYDETLIDRYLKYRDYKPQDPNSHFALQILDAFDWMEEHPEFREACDLIIDHLLTKYEIDMNQNNLMVRDKIIVIIDPVKSPVGLGPPENLPAIEAEVEQPPDHPSSDDDDLLDQLLK
jgi:hypothetical protein